MLATNTNEDQATVLRRIAFLQSIAFLSGLKHCSCGSVVSEIKDECVGSYVSTLSIAVAST